MIFNTKNYKNDMNGKIYYYTDYVKSLLKDIKDNGIDKDNMKKNNEKNYDKIINNV
jgi:hypothetical protein